LQNLKNLKIERCSDYSRVVEVVARAFAFLKYTMKVMDDGSIFRFSPNILLTVYSNGKVECYEIIGEAYGK